MSDLITRTARLTPYTKRPRQASGFVTAYTYEPAPGERTAGLGNLLVVIEVLSSGRIAEEVVDLVIETCGRRYYQDDSSSASLLDRFEAAIKSVNAELSHYIDQGNAAWVGKLSAIVAVQAGQELHLAQTGSVEAFLTRGRSSTRITASTAPRGPQANKTFGAITSGTLEADDRLLLATPALIHQLPLERLRALMASATPSGVIAELSGLLGDTSNADRIAALAVEVVTPEQAALQLRNEAPNDIVLQSEESPLVVAKQAAIPLAQSAVASGKRLRATAAQGLTQAKPHAKRSGKWIRRQLAALPSRPLILAAAGAVLIVIILAVIAFSAHSKNNHEVAILKQRYLLFATTVQSDAAALKSSGNHAPTEASLAKVRDQVNTLAKDHNRKALDRSLTSSHLPAGTPGSVAALQARIDQLLDQAEQVQHVTAKSVVSLTAKMSSYRFIASTGDRIVAITQDGRSIAVIDPQSGAVTLSKADTSRLGTIVATAPSSDGNGLYLLTSAPGVWLYQPGGDSLTQVAIETGGWPASSAITSYNSNLYLLANDGTIEKSLRTLSGFSPVIPAVSPSSLTSGAGALAIDGSIYVMNHGALSQYLSGQLVQSLPIPSDLSHTTMLQVFAGDTKLLAYDAASSRMGIFNFNGSQIVYEKQFAVTGMTVRGAVVDDTGQTIYLLTTSGIARFSLQ